ncbi:helix-turn-helix domain-containing protein [Streptomyces bauhiniae]|uniref:helix-turn-helix domain-containing protein n=1 Tax=Streptomyces bauhiniae TaxID=2340725 RepID=UPI003810B0C8
MVNRVSEQLGTLTHRVIGVQYVLTRIADALDQIVDRMRPAPALVHGPLACRLEDVAARTGLTLTRVHDCVRMLIKRGCVRQTGSAADGVPVCSLP